MVWEIYAFPHPSPFSFFLYSSFLWNSTYKCRQLDAIFKGVFLQLLFEIFWNQSINSVPLTRFPCMATQTKFSRYKVLQSSSLVPGAFPGQHSWQPMQPYPPHTLQVISASPSSKGHDETFPGLWLCSQVIPPTELYQLHFDISQAVAQKTVNTNHHGDSF